MFADLLQIDPRRAAEHVEGRTSQFGPSVYGEMALGNHHDAAHALWTEAMKHRVDHGGAGSPGRIEQELAYLTWIIEVLARAVVDLERKVPAQKRPRFLVAIRAHGRRLW